MRQILHLSDIHFGPRHLPPVAAGVLELTARRPPDLVVVSGDLTQRARPEQFRAAREFVDRLGVPSLAVPGNHDVPMYRFWERVLSPFGAYRRHFSEDLEPVFEDDEMAVVGVNTAFSWTIKDGRVRRSALDRLEDLLEGVDGGRAKVVVAHHQMVPAPRFDTQRVLDGSRELVEVLRRQEVDLVLSGHLHQTYIATTEAYYPSGGHPVLLLHAGTTTSSRGRGSERGRNTCNWVRLDDREIAVSHLGWHPDEGVFREWSRHSYPRPHRWPQGLGSF